MSNCGFRRVLRLSLTSLLHGHIRGHPFFHPPSASPFCYAHSCRSSLILGIFALFLFTFFIFFLPSFPSFPFGAGSISECEAMLAKRLVLYLYDIRSNKATSYICPYTSWMGDSAVVLATLQGFWRAIRLSVGLATAKRNVDGSACVALRYPPAMFPRLFHQLVPQVRLTQAARTRTWTYWQCDYSDREMDGLRLLLSSWAWVLENRLGLHQLHQ